MTTTRKTIVTRRDGTLSNVRPIRPMQARQLCDVIAPIVAGLDPARLYEDGTPPAIRRRIPDERPDLFEALRKAGYRRTWRDDWDDFAEAVRASPASHAVVAIVSVFGTLALIVAPFLFGWLQ
jgi:hypothetical protein